MQRFNKEFNRNFGSGLRAVPGGVPEEGGFPDAGFNAEGQFELRDVLLSSELDPITAPFIPEWSESNPFIASLTNAAGIGSGGIILWPIYSTLGRLTVWPDDVPANWVPCAGQVYSDPNGSEIRVPSMIAGSPDYYNSAYYKAVYLMKIPSGAELVRGRRLRRNFLVNYRPRPQQFSQFN